MSIELDSTWKSILDELVSDAQNTGAEALFLHFVLVDRAGEGPSPHTSGMGVMLSELVIEHLRHRHKGFSLPAHYYAQCLQYLDQKFAQHQSIRVIRDPIPREMESFALIFRTPSTVSTKNEAQKVQDTPPDMPDHPAPLC